MALITAAEAREALPGLTGTGEDTLLESIVAAVDSALATWCWFPPPSVGATPTLEDTTYTLYFDKPSSKDGRRLFLGLRPVQSITSVHYDPNWSYGSGDELTENTDFILDGVSGTLYRHPSSTQNWGRGLRSIKVVCVAGFATIPEEIKTAARLLLKHIARLYREQGRTQITVDDVQRQIAPEKLPPAVIQLLADVRLWGRAIG